MKKEAPAPEIEVLLQTYVEGSLAPAEAGTLLNLIKHDPSLGHVLLEHLESDAAIRAVVSQPDWFTGTKVSPTRIVEAGHLFRPPSRRLVIALAACIAFLVLCTSLFFAREFQPVLAGNFTQPVRVNRAGTELHVLPGFRLKANDKVVAGAESIALDYAPEQTRIELSPGTTLTLGHAHRGKRLDLADGELLAKVAPQSMGRPMILYTDHAQARVLGTEFVLQTTPEQTRLAVLEGKVRFTRESDERKVDVDGGYYAETLGGGAFVSKPITGKILREVWLQLSGDTLQNLIFDPRFPNSPDHTDYPSSFDSHTNWTSAFGTRSRGFVTVPQSGDYVFSVRGNGQIRLFLSPDDDPGNKAIVAQIIFSPNKAEGDTARVASSNKSEPIKLEAGQRYYIEVLHKFGIGNDELAVIWQRPDGKMELIPPDALTLFAKAGGQ